jgi:hypothetical protein
VIISEDERVSRRHPVQEDMPMHQRVLRFERVGWYVDGRFLHHRMRRARLTEDDILESARDSQGIEKIEQVKFAIVERNGKISIIPAE